MPYYATVYKVMIASPSDVANERRIIREVIHEWNSIHSEDKGIVLMPAGWETHSSPSMGERPQEIINQQVLKDCDLLVVTFWTRIGSPTGQSPSGTVEEIEQHLAAGKPAMIYFSSAPVRPDSVDDQQYAALREFKRQCQQRGLIETYESLSEFRGKFARQLAQTIIRDFSSKKLSDVAESEISVEPPSIPAISDEAKQLLVEASLDKHGTVLITETAGGVYVETNDKNFAESGNPRSEALWKDTVGQLWQHGCLEAQDHEGEIFRITTAGYKLADTLSQQK